MDRRTQPPTLRPIPFVEGMEASPLALVEVLPEHLSEVMEEARRQYGGLALRLGDGLSRRWLARSQNPYRDEIAAIAGRVGRPGMVLLNLSYEWTCTARVAGARRGHGSRLLRTLDWQLDGLGRAVVVARREGPAGPYHDVTWPGFVGVATAMAGGASAPPSTSRRCAASRPRSTSTGCSTVLACGGGRDCRRRTC